MRWACRSLTRGEFEAAAAQARRRQRHDDSVLPASLTSFIERSEVYELQNLLAAHRLLTITGSGGVGNTRIAIEVARRVEHLYDEMWFVDLLPLRGGNLVRSQIAARLNVQLRGDDGLTEIAHRLRSRRVLLVIDNCEHVVVEAASVIERLLGRSTTLTVMATSREALAVPGELAYRLPSMDAENRIRPLRRAGAGGGPEMATRCAAPRACGGDLQRVRRHPARNRDHRLARLDARA